MIFNRTIVAAWTLGVLASFATTASFAAPVSTQAAAHESEVSAAKRHYHRHYVRQAGPRYAYQHRGNDPSLAANGLPYRVPPHLRNQCYIDEGYGRFSSCPNR